MGIPMFYSLDIFNDFLFRIFVVMDFEVVLTSATSATLEGPQGIFSKNTFLKSVHPNKKKLGMVEIFTDRGGVLQYIFTVHLVVYLQKNRLSVKFNMSVCFFFMIILSLTAASRKNIRFHIRETFELRILLQKLYKSGKMLL